MKKTLTTWLAGAAMLFAISGALPVAAQDAAKPEAAAVTAPAAEAPAPAATIAAPAAPEAAPAAAATAATTAAPAPAAAAAPVVPHKGDTAWMFVATLLVILMTIPGLALFYGGLCAPRTCCRS